MVRVGKKEVVQALGIVGQNLVCPVHSAIGGMIHDARIIIAPVIPAGPTIISIQELNAEDFFHLTQGFFSPGLARIGSFVNRPVMRQAE